MALIKLKAASFLHIENDRNINILPIILDIYPQNTRINVFCYEQPLEKWKSVFGYHTGAIYYDEFKPESYDHYCKVKSFIFIASINQMVLNLGWPLTLKYLLKLKQETNIEKVIVVLHTDCLLPTSKLPSNLNHIATASISFDPIDHTKIFIGIKKSGKLLKSTEILDYDSKTNSLKSIPVTKEVKKDDEPQTLPANLSTFKIEMEPSEKVQRLKLKLPYMSKIHEGESKVFYEPDAVDDWDEEDPDDDLDI